MSDNYGGITIAEAGEGFMRLGKALNESMAAWRKAHGIPEWTDPGYEGNRCGWYPAKPKRRRRNPR